MIRKGQKFTISGQPSVYRAIAPQMSDAEYALGGWARDMYRRWIASGRREEQQINALRRGTVEAIRFTIGGEGKIILDGEEFGGRCKNCEHWEKKSGNGACHLKERVILTRPTDLCREWEKCKRKSWAG